LADLRLGSRAVFALALLASACGGSSSDRGGAGGADPGVILSGGASGSNGLAGSGSGGGSGSAGAGHSAGTPSSGEECPVVTPCGGNLVGEWTIKQECITLPAEGFTATCPGLMLMLSPLTVSGTISFKADNTLSSSGTISFTESLRYPPSCADEAECSFIESALATQAGATNVQCEYDAATGCSCTLTSSQQPMRNGTYEVQGTNVALTSSTSATPEIDSFCVSGNTLSLYQRKADGSSATLILTK
jgi:hypothetical protein